MRVIFMGSPEFSVPVLDALVDAGHDICAVYCQPPRRAGRGKQERPTPVHTRALELGLDVRHPTTLRTEETQQDFAVLNADVAVVVAYGLILRQPVLDAPAHGCLNIHASLLPRWRGAAPIHRAIMAGDEETGVCIMQMDAGLDTGPVLMRSAIPIGETDTTADLHDRLSALGAAQIVKALAQINQLAAEPQPETGVTYAEKIDKAEAQIDWRQPAEVIDRIIRGLSPFPGAWTMLGDTRLKLLGSRVSDGEGEPGTVLLDPLRVCCADRAIELSYLQRAGKGVQSAEVFLTGTPVTAGTKLGGHS